jgi:hypothetical protein
MRFFWYMLSSDRENFSIYSLDNKTILGKNCAIYSKTEEKVLYQENLCRECRSYFVGIILKKVVSSKEIPANNI